MTPTKEKLALALDASGFDFLADEARAGYFSDFESEHPFPKKLLIDMLAKIRDHPDSRRNVRNRARTMIERVNAGEFDDSSEEATAWAMSPEAQEIRRAFEDAEEERA